MWLRLPGPHGLSDTACESSWFQMSSMAAARDGRGWAFSVGALEASHRAEHPQGKPRSLASEGREDGSHFLVDSLNLQRPTSDSGQHPQSCLMLRVSVSWYESIEVGN